MKKLTVSTAGDGTPLLHLLVKSLGISGKKAKKLLDARHVFVNGRRVWMARHTIHNGDSVEIVQAARVRARNERGSPAPAPILYEDEQYLVVNKPAGALATGNGSLEHQLRTSLGNPTITAVHRLDRDTSGCMIYAKSLRARDDLVPAFRRRKVFKEYHAIVEGSLTQQSRMITRPVDGQRARTTITTLATTALASHLQIVIETGRTHQIRKHLAAIRHPVAGDRAYGTKAPRAQELREAPRHMLHATKLEFPHPATGVEVRVKAPLPRDFKKYLGTLGLR